MLGKESRGGLQILRLQRTDKANALTATTLEALTRALDEAAAAGVGAVVLTGAGSVFSGGADLAEARTGLAASPLWERLSARVATMPCLTIAALNGTAAGGSLGMVLACDIRIAVPQAQLFYPVMRLGFLPPASDVRRLTGLIGQGRARMLLLAGQRIDADEARDWGLIDRIVPAEELIAAAEALAAAALAATPDHVMAIKALCGEG